jgi:4-amino-4-deoxychorismate lyase
MGYIETLLITNEIKNLKYHNNRINLTRKILYDLAPIDLKNYIDIKRDKRVRVLYDKEILKIEYFDLVKREFKKLKIVENNNIKYSFKSENREQLNSLKVDGYDEIIIIKNGLITDTTISNLAFFNGKEWHTPKNPLLKGTKRAELLDENILIEKNIKIDDINKYQKVAMMNAIIGFYIVGGMECIS